MTSKPHDALFKVGFDASERAAGLLCTVLPPAIVREIDWSSLSRVPGSFIDVALGDRHTDLLFSARFRDRQVLLYLLLEHQSTVDPDMPLRMLIYMVRIWEQHRKKHPSGPLPLIVPVLVCNARGGWTAPVAFHDILEPHPASIHGLEGLVPQFSLLLEDLITVSNDTLAQWTIDDISKLVLWALRDARDLPKLIDNLQYWAETLRRVLATPNGTEVTAQILRYVSLVGGRMYYEEFRATLREQLPDAEGVMETIANWLHEEGRQEGRREGRQEGRQEGRRELLVLLLSTKFGTLEPAALDRVAAASDELLERYTQRLLTAETLEAVFDP